LPNNIVLFVTIDKFDPNPVLVNINELKPYRFIEDKTLQHVLVKLGDLVITEPIQTKEHVTLSIEPEAFQLVNFKPVSNHSTPSSIKTLDVFIHHYHNLLI
jgi:hypothetical protein